MTPCASKLRGSVRWITTMIFKDGAPPSCERDKKAMYNATKKYEIKWKKKTTKNYYLSSLPRPVFDDEEVISLLHNTLPMSLLLIQDLPKKQRLLMMFCLTRLFNLRCSIQQSSFTWSIKISYSRSWYNLHNNHCMHCSFRKTSGPHWN